MARLARIVLPGIPHHITQRGNRRERVFFEDSDYALYLDLLAEAAERAGVAIWSYCLMPNHVRIVAVPGDEDGLRRTFRYVHLSHLLVVARPIEHQMYGRDVVFTTGIAEHGDVYVVASGEADLACRITHIPKATFA